MSVAQHLEAIRSMLVTKGNMIGIRKILNTYERTSRGYSVSRMSTKATAQQIKALETALDIHKPLVSGELRDSGLKLLRDKRYAKRLEPYAGIIETITCFRLIRFGWIDGMHCVPVYCAVSPAGTFDFQNIPWQSGGKGPEILNEGKV